MPLYQYQAIDNEGKKRSGLMEGVSESDVKGKLRGQRMMVMQLTEKKAASSRQNLRGDDLVGFTLQLSQLVNAGIPLYESLLAIEEQYRSEPYHRILLSLCEQIKAGTSLSEAMSNYPQSFDKLYCAMVMAGESIGALDMVLRELAGLLEKKAKLKKQIVTAMVYPSILAVFAFLVILLLLGFVIPSIEQIFIGRELNTFTTIVLGISRFFRSYWWLCFGLLGGLVTYLVLGIRSKAGKLWMERNFLKVPFIRTLMVQAAVARFSRTMETLQRGGLTIMDSLRISRGVMGNIVLEEEIARAEERIIEGSSLSAEIGKSEWFPPIVPRMLSVGEDSGTTVAMLGRVADMYEADLEKTLQRVMALAEPVILIIMGVVIGVILLAILLPLTDVSSFAT